MGAGGMGEVYRTKDSRLDRTVAIKALPSHLSDDLDLKQRMEREAKPFPRSSTQISAPSEGGSANPW
jgi:eukaryotic-like serine/threonine-protein kinase